jgi:hypothetical protein
MNKLFALLLVVLPLTAAAAVDVREGLWELGATVHLENQTMGPYTRQQCITKEDLQHPERIFGETNGSCDYTSKRYFGNQFSFNVRCNSGIPLTGTGEVEYGADWMTGHMELSAQVSGGPTIESTSEIAGKRLGDCTH